MVVYNCHHEGYFGFSSDLRYINSDNTYRSLNRLIFLNSHIHIATLKKRVRKDLKHEKPGSLRSSRSDSVSINVYLA